MKVGLLLSTLVVFGGLAANTGHARVHPVPAKSVAKPASTSLFPPAASKRGSIGGPANKGQGINGTGTRGKH